MTGIPTPRQLEIFCKAAANCNFRDTADRLGISQAAISDHISALERKVGHKLFVRRRGMTPVLSEDGQRLLATAHRVLELSREFSSGKDHGASKKRVIVGLRHFLLETIVRSSISTFIDTNADIELEIRIVDDVTEMEHSVRSGALDIGVYRGDPPVDPTMIARVLNASSCSIYAAPRLATHIEEADMSLDRAPFLLLPEYGRASGWIVRRLIDAGITPQNVVSRTQFPNVLIEWLLAGRGVGVLFDRTAFPYVERQMLSRLGPRLAPVKTFFLAGNNVKPERSRVMDFLEHLLGTG